jgi:hypothetical protein
VFERLDGRFVNMSIKRRVKYLFDKRRFPRARHARHDRKQPKRKLNVDVLEIVTPCALDLDAVAVRKPPQVRHLDLQFAAEVFPSE